jgi:hypothetical protein
MWEGTRRGIKLHNEEFHDLYASDIVKAIRSRRVWQILHVSRVGEKRHAYSFGGKPERKTHLEDM